MRFPLSQRLAPLCRLQWVMAWRHSRGTPYERVFLLGVLVPAMVGGGAGMAFMMFGLSRRVSAESPHHMGLFLIGTGGFLTASYLVSLALERKSTLGVDFSRLFHFPVSPGEVVASQVVGYAMNPLFMGFPAVIFLGCTAGILAAGRHLLASCALAGTILWVVQISLLLAVGELIRLHVRLSPRLARAVMVGALLAGVAGLLVWVSVGGTPAEDRYFGGLVELAKRIWSWGRDWIILLPGISPLAWVGGGWRNAGALPAALVEIAGLSWASTRLVGRLMREGVAAPAVATGGAGSVSGSRVLFPWERLTWWPHFERELKCTLRERYQVVSIACLCFAAFFLPRVAEMMGSFGEAFAHHGIPFALAGLLAMGTLNQFGLEAASLTLVLASPFPRWACLFGKNLVGFLLLLVLLSGQEAIRAAQGAGAKEISADMLFAMGTLAILSGLGNYFSFLLPYPAAVPGKNLFPQISQGRLMVISLCQMVYLGLAAYALLPLLAGRVALAHFGGSALGWSLIAGAMVLYGACFYGMSLAGAGRALLKLEPYLYEKLQKANA